MLLESDVEAHDLFPPDDPGWQWLCADFEQEASAWAHVVSKAMTRQGSELGDP